MMNLHTAVVPADTDLRAALVALWCESMEAFGVRDRPVVEFAGPEDLQTRLARQMPLALSPEVAAADPSEIVAVMREIVAASVHSDHPRFFNQNFAGADEIAVLGDAFGALLNTTNATYEVAPVFTLLERELTARMAELAGFGRPDPGAADPAGIFCPGGSTANLYAMQVARHRAHPELIEEGAASGPELVVLSSEQSHYSIDKSVRLLGLGRRSLVKVPCDAKGAMRLDALELALEACVQRGHVPFFVNATAGTTVTAAFDDIAGIVALAARFGSWVHVDAAVGGGALFSPRERHLLEGIEGVDSLTWNLHKLSGATQQCSVLLLREPGRLRRAFSTKAEYLFQADKNNRDLDTGDLTFQCARRNDALKAWLMWKARGEAALGARVEHAVDLARHLENWVQTREDFVVALPRVFTNLCFWWIPADMRSGFDVDELDEGGRERLHRLAPAIKDRMQREGKALVGYQPIAGLPNCWRMIFINPEVSWEDVEFTMELIARYGEALVSAD
jgi:glutamate/tyrosine decarboxylase-like PLP-dependent enzyme